MKYWHGVTLIEIMVALAIVAILMLVAVPGFQSMIQNNRALTLSSDFVSALNYARSEAIRRGQFVSVCPATDTDYDTCGAATQWVNGWLVFVDPDANGVLANTADRLSVHDAFAAGTVISTSSSAITFAATGMANSGQSTFNLSATGCSGQHGRVVVLSEVGSTTVATTACS